MKIVVNRCYGGFGMSDEAKRAIEHIPEDIDEYSFRTHKDFVKLVEDDPKRASAPYAALEVETIPDEATDWMIKDYDGYEDIIYVLNGKLHYA